MGRPKYQVNTVEGRSIEPREQWPKYVVGTRLVFRGTSPGEAHVPSQFQPGDLLKVVEKNGCGMGIDVRRMADGVTDMVWPEEVEIESGVSSVTED